MLSLITLNAITSLITLSRGGHVLIRRNVRHVHTNGYHPNVRTLVRITGGIPSQVITSSFNFTLKPEVGTTNHLSSVSFNIRLLVSGGVRTTHHVTSRLSTLGRAQGRVRRNVGRRTVTVYRQLRFNTRARLPFKLMLFRHS